MVVLRLERSEPEPLLVGVADSDPIAGIVADEVGVHPSAVGLQSAEQPTYPVNVPIGLADIFRKPGRNDVDVVSGVAVREGRAIHWHAGHRTAEGEAPSTSAK